MNKIIIFSVVTAVVLASYFWAIPTWNSHRHERVTEQLEKEKIEAQLKLDIAIAEESARLNELCFSDNVTILKGEDSDIDGGTKPNAHATATIKASDDHFILGKTVKWSRSGTNRFKSHKATKNPHQLAKDTEYANVILASASYYVGCEHKNIFGTSTCRATASIVGQQLPNECIAAILNKGKDDIISKFSEQKN